MQREVPPPPPATAAAGNSAAAQGGSAAFRMGASRLWFGCTEDAEVQRRVLPCGAVVRETLSGRVEVFLPVRPSLNLKHKTLSIKPPCCSNVHSETAAATPAEAAEATFSTSVAVVVV